MTNTFTHLISLGLHTVFLYLVWNQTYCQTSASKNKIIKCKIAYNHNSSFSQRNALLHFFFYSWEYQAAWVFPQLTEETRGGLREGGDMFQWTVRYYFSCAEGKKIKGKKTQQHQWHWVMLSMQISKTPFPSHMQRYGVPSYYFFQIPQVYYQTHHSGKHGNAIKVVSSLPGKDRTLQSHRMLFKVFYRFFFDISVSQTYVLYILWYLKVFH